MSQVFRPMRRFKQELSYETNLEILQNATSGVLAVTGDEGYPYAVPLSYAFKDNCLYFHSALTGHKLDAILKNDKVSFCVVAEDNIVPEKFTTVFCSVIAFGRARIIEEKSEKIAAFELIIKKYSPDLIKEGADEIAKAIHHAAIIELKIEHLSGKQAKEKVAKS